MADKKKSKKRIRPARRWFVLFAVVIGAAVVFTGTYMMTGGQPQTGGSHVTQAPDQGQGTPGAKPNPHYSHLLHEQNEQKEKQASKSGKSFIPTVGDQNNQTLGLSLHMASSKSNGASSEDNNKQNTAPASVPKPADNPTAGNNAGNGETSNIQPQPQEHISASASANNRHSAVMRELKEVMKQEAPPSQTVAVYHGRQHGGGESKGGNTQMASSNQPSGKQVSNTASQNSGQAQHKQAGENPKAGDIYYATMDTALDSDQPGPAMATIISGPHKGDKVLGKFQRHGDALVVKFTKFIPSKGKPQSISAYAVNTNTSRASVATAVNHHYLARWGGLVAASFAEGFGQAVQQSGSVAATSIGAGGANTLVSHPGRSAGQEAEQALGKVGQRAGQQISKNFNEPPTVRLAAGTPVGILVIKGKSS